MPNATGKSMPSAIKSRPEGGIPKPLGKPKPREENPTGSAASPALKSVMEERVKKLVGSGVELTPQSKKVLAAATSLGSPSTAAKAFALLKRKGTPKS
jgi:hypothetical protein